jgi:hypothetical protein
LEVELPGPRLLEPVGTICHLTGQTRPWLISLAEYRGAGEQLAIRGGEGGGEGSDEERS